MLIPFMDNSQLLTVCTVLLASKYRIQSGPVKAITSEVTLRCTEGNAVSANQKREKIGENPNHLPITMCVYIKACWYSVSHVSLHTLRNAVHTVI